MMLARKLFFLVSVSALVSVGTANAEPADSRKSIVVANLDLAREQVGLDRTPDELVTASVSPAVPQVQKAIEGAKVPSSEAEAELRSAIERMVGELFNTGNGFERKDRDAIVEFYTARNYQPLWVTGEYFNSHGKAITARLAAAEEDGLNSSDYPTYELLGGEDLESIAAAELQLSEMVLKYARHAQAGRILPSRVSSGFKNKPVYPEPYAVLAKLSDAEDKGAVLRDYNPPQPGFKALRDELAKLRSAEAIEPNVIIPKGKALYIGVKSNRVAILRERLNVPALDDEDPRKFDKTLRTAVKAFQKEHDLKADGIVGSNTIAFMNGVSSDRTADLIANMERWRWLPRDMGKLHIVANVPSYNVTIYKGDKNIHRTRVVVGKTRHKTPIFSDVMEVVVVNPHWNVPRSIATKELLPRIRSNPEYVASRNYEVLQGGRVVDPLSVNWEEANFNRIRIRQKPGTRNALGAVKFLFPNPYAIYFHDTPSKSLFQRVTRAFSHGCVRIHRPFEFGNVIMRETKGWNKGRLRSMVGGREKFISLRKDEKVPVHLTYFTAVSNDAGRVSYKNDIYGHHRRTKRALGLI